MEPRRFWLRARALKPPSAWAVAGIRAVLSGYVGPKAFAALQAADIAVYQDLDGRSVREAVRCYLEGGVTAADAPNKQA